MDMKTALIMLKNTLQSVEIKGTQENCDKMLGCYMLIDSMQKALDTVKTDKERMANENDGNSKGQNIYGGLDVACEQNG